MPLTNGSSGATSACPGVSRPIVPEITAATCKHLFEGEVHGKDATGVHHVSAITGNFANYIDPATSKKPRPYGSPPGMATAPDWTRPLGPDPPGLYQSYVEVKKSPGVFIKKYAVSTFFPKAWTQQQVKEQISGAFLKKDPMPLPPPAPPTKWTGISPSGVKIEGYLDDAGNIKTCYPVLP
jgi:hypothetical protein